MAGGLAGAGGGSLDGLQSVRDRRRAKGATHEGGAQWGGRGGPRDPLSRER